MGVVIDRNPGDPIVFHLNTSTMQDSLVDQPTGYPTIRITYSLDGVTDVDVLAETVMTAVPSKTIRNAILGQINYPVS